MDPQVVCLLYPTSIECQTAIAQQQQLEAALWQQLLSLPQQIQAQQQSEQDLWRQPVPQAPPSQFRPVGHPDGFDDTVSYPTSTVQSPVSEPAAQARQTGGTEDWYVTGVILLVASALCMWGTRQALLLWYDKGWVISRTVILWELGIATLLVGVGALVGMQYWEPWYGALTAAGGASGCSLVIKWTESALRRKKIIE